MSFAWVLAFCGNISSATPLKQRHSCRYAFAELQNGKIIGHGSFGQVKIAQHLLTGYKAAVKLLNSEKMKSAEMEEKGRYIGYPEWSSVCICMPEYFQQFGIFKPLSWMLLILVDSNMDGPTGRGTRADTLLQNYRMGKSLAMVHLDK
ncbi:hypothetical protein Vadar_001657 [Vaccinium darrowii]|nr:hypothetical protein Vadar_001657 [Vaccinium darrowii]